MGNLRPWELLIILAIILLLFGAKKLPDAARGLGRSLKIFKAETKGLRDDDGSTDAGTTTAAQQPVAEPRAVTPQPTTAPPTSAPQAEASTPAPGEPSRRDA